MSVRTIRNKAGQVVGFQAVAGAGKGSGTTQYFAASGGEEKARRMAERASAAMNAARPWRGRPALGANAHGLPGLRLVYRPSRRAEDPPRLCVVATGIRKGQAFGRCYSTDKHGAIGAATLALQAREKLAGVRLGLTPRQVWNRISAAFEARQTSR